MYTLEVGGKAIAVTNADEEQARELFMSEDFKADLLSLRSENQPLWDGIRRPQRARRLRGRDGRGR